MSKLGRSLPVNWYLDAEHFNLERISIFRKEWLFAAPESRFHEAGDYVTVSVMGYEVVIIKQLDSTLKAFYNVCRHRGSQLLSPSSSGKCKAGCITCPYHAWTYNLDGSLRKAPKFDDIEDLCKEDYSLHPIEVKIVHGLVFFSLDPKSESTLFSTLEEILDTYPIENYEYHSSKVFEIQCNWKTWVENYQECYHCRTLHPLFNRNYQLDKYGVINTNKVSHHTCPRKEYDPMCSRDCNQGDTELQSRDGFWVFAYPNLALSMYETYYDTLEILPLSPNKTRLVVTFYSRKDLPKEEINKNIEEVSFQTFQEDIESCERVYKGLAALNILTKTTTPRTIPSDVEPVGPLHPIHESGVIYFDTLIRNSMSNN
jgi:choline monooxygenase